MSSTEENPMKRYVKPRARVFAATAVLLRGSFGFASDAFFAHFSL